MLISTNELNLMKNKDIYKILKHLPHKTLLNYKRKEVTLLWRILANTT